MGAFFGGLRWCAAVVAVVGFSAAYADALGPGCRPDTRVENIGTRGREVVIGGSVVNMAAGVCQCVKIKIAVQNQPGGSGPAHQAGHAVTTLHNLEARMEERFSVKHNLPESMTPGRVSASIASVAPCINAKRGSPTTESAPPPSRPCKVSGRVAGKRTARVDYDHDGRMEVISLNELLLLTEEHRRTRLAPARITRDGRYRFDRVPAGVYILAPGQSFVTNPRLPTIMCRGGAPVTKNLRIVGPKPSD